MVQISKPFLIIHAHMWWESSNVEIKKKSCHLLIQRPTPRDDPGGRCVPRAGTIQQEYTVSTHIYLFQFSNSHVKNRWSHIYTSGCIVLLPANITEVRVLVLSLAPQDLVQNPLYKWSLNWNKPPLLSLGHKWSKVCKSALDMTWGMSMISWIWHPVLVKLKF